MSSIKSLINLSLPLYRHRWDLLLQLISKQKSPRLLLLSFLRDQVSLEPKWYCPLANHTDEDDDVFSPSIGAGEGGLEQAAEDLLAGLYIDNRYKTGEGVEKAPVVDVGTHLMPFSLYGIHRMDGG